MSARKLPQTDSIEALARFWDTHDLTDFEEQLEEVPESVFERQRVVRISLPAQDVAAVKKLAKAKGLRYSDLLREWILEKVRAS